MPILVSSSQSPCRALLNGVPVEDLASTTVLPLALAAVALPRQMPGQRSPEALVMEDVLIRLTRR